MNHEQEHNTEAIKTRQLIMNQADLETVKHIRDMCMQSYPNTPNRIRAEALTTLLNQCDDLQSQLKEQSAEIERLRLALRERAIGVDEMSYHGELMVCSLCGSTWNNGRKRSDPATPEWHKPDCLIA